MRTNSLYAYICRMKERLNLTIDAELVESMKAYAASKQMSVSELVESYFRTVTRPLERKNIVELIDGLGDPIDKTEDGNWLESPAHQWKEKYGI
jgi:hypothetical protein